MGTTNELDIITRIRGEATRRNEMTGKNPFLIWGYSIVIAYLLTFAAMMLCDNDLFLFILCGIPLVGVPYMQNNLHEDYNRNHVRTKEDNYVLKVWLFVGFACGFAALATGFAGVHHQCLFALASLLIGMGSLFTGVIMRFRPKVVCGIIACLLSAIPLFLQDELWAWQLFVTAIVTVIALIIPGHMFNSHLRKYHQLSS